MTDQLRFLRLPLTSEQASLHVTDRLNGEKL